MGCLKNVKRVQLLPLSWELAHIVGENNFETEVKFIIQSVCVVETNKGHFAPKTQGVPGRLQSLLGTPYSIFGDEDTERTQGV